MSTVPPDPRYALQPPPQKKKSRWWIWPIIILVMLILLGSCVAAAVRLIDGDPAAIPATSETPASSAPAKKKAKPYTATVTKCGPGDYGFDVTVKITNKTGDNVTYIFDLLLLDPKDDTVGSGIGTVEVKPGKSASTTLVASLDESYEGKKSKVTCEVKVTDW